MGVYKLSIKSEIDLAEMYEYCISEFGFRQAKAYFNEMHEVFQLGANNSELGRDASEFIEKLRRFSFRATPFFIPQQKMEYSLSGF